MDEQEAWINSRPPAVAAAARKTPPTICYRSQENAGHYRITSYSEPEDGGPITVRVAHGADSYSPGIEVFGVDPETLVPCDCGKWEWPTPDQADATLKRIKAPTN